MVYSKTGLIADNLWRLGLNESSVYLLEGEKESLLIGGGMSYLVPFVLEQFKELGIDEDKIKNCLILHAHFDHIGVIAFFKRRNPEMGILASSRAWQILAMPKAIKTINDFGRKLTRKMGHMDAYSQYELDWEEGVTGRTVEDRDEIDLGGVSVRIYETPGHSSCSISAYVPDRKILFPSDAGGIPFKGSIIASGNSNFSKYQKSLSRLNALEVEMLCADHYGYLTGDDAGSYIDRSIEIARQRRSQIEESFDRLGSVDSVVNEVVREFYDKNPEYMLPEEIAYGVNKQIVRHIVSSMDSAEKL